MNEIISKIRAEIERRRNISVAYDMSGGNAPLYDELLSFLDTLEEPKKDYNKLYEDIAKSEWFKKSYVGKSLGDVVPVEEPVCGDLEEAVTNYIAPIENEDGLRVINFSGQDIKDAFIAGANWQKEQDKEWLNSELIKAHLDGVKAGDRVARKQMMKEAIDAIARPYEQELWCDFTDLHFDDNEPVKVIIIRGGRRKL